MSTSSSTGAGAPDPGGAPVNALGADSPGFRALLDATTNGQPVPVDPYLLWAYLTNFAYFRKRDGVDLMVKVPVLIEAKRPFDQWSPEQQASVKDLVQDGWPGQWDQGYWTGYVETTRMPELVRMQIDGLVLRFQLALPRSLPRSHFEHDITKDKPGVHTLGVIDDACCIAHEALVRRTPMGKKRTRLTSVWLQDPGVPTTPPWIRPKVMTSQGLQHAPGRELEGWVIDVLLGRLGDGRRAEHELYATTLGQPAWGRDDRIHGSGVLHLFAGRGAQSGPEPHVPPPSATAPVVFVQLPTLTVADSSGASLGSNVLDGVRYIVDRAQRGAGHGKPWRATVNISVGSLAGPHDGSTIVEQALDRLVDTHGDRLALVFAAGNAANRRIHAHRRIDSRTPGRFDVMVVPGNPAESFVEFWVRDEQLANGGLDKLAVTVTTPGASSPIEITVGHLVTIDDEHGNTLAAATFARRVAQGTAGTMLLLAIRPTQVPPGSFESRTAPHGAWSVTFASKLSTPLDVHAWVERNEAIVGRRGGQRTRFVPERPAGREGDYVTPDYTLSSIAHGRCSIVVGSTIGTRTGKDVVAPYSGRGGVFGRNDTKPDHLRPGEASHTLPGQRVPGFWRGTTRRLGGTSAAAPQVARHLVDTAPVDQGSGLV